MAAPDIQVPGGAERILLHSCCAPCSGAIIEYLVQKGYKPVVFYSNSNRLSLSIAFVVLTIALSYIKIPAGSAEISFSSLLVCMMLGTVFCNFSEYSVDIMNRSSKWTAPLYALFFVLSGAELDLGVFRYPAIVLIGIVYILVRCLGKYFGARLSSSLMHCNETVRKYLGITLFGQYGAQYHTLQCPGL